mgnify:CR=1 FL=1
MEPLKYINKLKVTIEDLIQNKKYNKALKYISLCSDLLYHYNQYYCDKDLENDIKQISESLLQKSNIKKLDEDVVVFYDGIGADRRGLAYIYVYALTKFKKVVYVTKEKQKYKIPTISKILKKNNCIKIFIPDKDNITKIKFVKEVIDTYKPKNVFMYTVPDDVVITTLFHHYENIITRYQINLTDHAFWIGASCLDYCIEFRNYGAYISNNYRFINKDKIVLLPYYPFVDKSIEFEGFPFEFNDIKPKLIFSGGSLYKTFGGGNKYYLIVDYILQNFKEAIFWYAGAGDCSEFYKLIKKYPNRIFLTDERKDLYQILKRCYFYLSTYPVCGGLMFQYAAIAGKLPLTLKFDDCVEGFLINQDELDIEFENLEELKEKIRFVFKNEDYIKEQKDIMVKAVIKPDEFEKELKNLIENQNTNFKITFEYIDISRFLKVYEENMTYKNLCNIIGGHKNFWIFPKEVCMKKLFQIRDRFESKLKRG